MGTNFYLRDGTHIGKRSAAGMYCWDCGVTLCKGGGGDLDDEWFTKCPVCGKSPDKEPLEESSTGRELGFNDNPPAPKTGVASCSSFSWAMKPDHFERAVRNYPPDKFTGHPVVDEYETEFTGDEFTAILSECPVRFYDSIGHEFS